jgi:hypothetical protein
VFGGESFDDGHLACFDGRRLGLKEETIVHEGGPRRPNDFHFSLQKLAKNVKSSPFRGMTSH